MNNYDNRDVVCPYFHKCKTGTIVCEGIAPGAISIQRFINEKGMLLDDKRKAYMDQYCKSTDYKECLLAQALKEKYE